MSVNLKIILFLVHRVKKKDPSALIDLANEFFLHEPSSEAFQPFPENAKYMPNFCSAFCCQYWSGLCLDRIHSHALVLNDLECSIFALNGSMIPVEKDHVQRGLQVYHGQEENLLGALTNSIKIHFYRSEIQMDSQEKLDFLYSSSIPLLFDDSYYVTDVFNFNCNDCNCTNIEDCKLVAFYVDKTKLQGITQDLIVKNRGPSKTTSDHVVQMANWCEDVLSILCPASTSSFLNMRTFCRDFGNSLFFQDLPCLFREDQFVSSVPLEIMFYSCLNALNENSVSALEFPRLLEKSTMNDVDVLNGLRIVRDCLTPWTFCCYEGLYSSDTSLKQNVEDQPFPFSFVRGQRIFQKDDCEGRVCEAHVMAQLFKTFYSLLVPKAGLENLQHKIYTYAKYYFDQGCENTRIDIPFNHWCDLLGTCYHIGKLLHEDILEIHTTVGDVNFAVFNGESSHGEEESKGEMVGHSFGVLVFHDSKKKNHVCILECTGWERVQTPTDIPLSAKELDLMRHIVKYKLDGHCPLKINVCGYLPCQRENNVYKNICLGTECIFFSINEAMTEGSRLHFGTSLQNLKSGKIIDFEHLRHKTLSDFEKAYIKNSGQFTLKFNTRDFFSEMCGLSKQISNCSNKLPVLSYFDWLDVKKMSNEKKENLAQCMKRAFEMQNMHSTYEKNIPEVRKCLATPHKHFSEYLILMKRNWKVISSKGYEGGICRGIRFSIQSKKEEYTSCEDTFEAFMKKCSDPNLFKIDSRPFMHSVIYHIYERQV